MSVTGQDADPLSCTILVKPIIRVGLFSVTMVRGAFACATHDGLLAGVLTSNSELPAFTPALRLREPPFAVGGMHFLVYLKGEELSLSSHLTSNIKLLRCCHPTPLPGLSPVSRERIARTSLYRGAWLFRVHLAGKEFRLPSGHQLSKYMTLPAIPLLCKFRLIGSHGLVIDGAHDKEYRVPINVEMLRLLKQRKNSLRFSQRFLLVCLTRLLQRAAMAQAVLSQSMAMVSISGTSFLHHANY